MSKDRVESPDGAHIIVSHITFFYNYYPELIARGYIYIGCTPLFKASKNGEEPKYFYNDAELKAADTEGWHVQRYKGLGEMTPEQLWETSLDPTKRRLKQLTIPDADKMRSAVELCMGSAVKPRKEFILSHAFTAIGT